jgi:hypothetical protein
VRFRGGLLRPLLRSFRQLLFLHIPLPSLLLRRLGLLLGLGHRGADRGHQLVLIQVGVPDVHRAHLRESGDGFPVSRHRRQCRRPRVGLGESVVAARDRKTRRHPLHVVLERPRQRLIEVVHIEQQDPLRRGEQPEIRQMGIPAQLGLQAGHWRVRQIRRHDLGRAPVERERRDHHPAMTHRHQIRLTGAILFLQQAHRIRTARGRLPLRMARQSRPVPGLQTPGLAILDVRMRDLPHRHPAHRPFLPPHIAALRVMGTPTRGSAGTASALSPGAASRALLMAHHGATMTVGTSPWKEDLGSRPAGVIMECG